MDNPPFHKGHKRNRSTHIPEYFKSKKGKPTHNRQSSSSSLRNTSLPNNRAYFVGNILRKSHIPTGAKQRINHRTYHKIPNNKYLVPTAKSNHPNYAKNIKSTNMAAKQPGTVNDTHGLLRKADDSSHWFETRLVEKKPAKEHRGRIIPPCFGRSTMTVSMPTAMEWPSYTFTLSALNFVNQSTTHYTMNMGLRNKSVIELVKASTKFQYKVMSNQSWKCRTIVWCSDQAGPFNRAMTAHNQQSTTAMEYELTNNMGKMTQPTSSTCIFKWEEQTYNEATDTMASQDRKEINNILKKPTNTKYPSTPFYWKPNDGITTIYDATTTIPGKQHHLLSEMYEDDTWQKGPGLVEYKDNIGRGGEVKTISPNIKFQKNWHMTLIWQPDGDFSGRCLDTSEEDPENTLEVDIIHTVFWNQ
jgi:hypothetical protein